MLARYSGGDDGGNDVLWEGLFALLLLCGWIAWVVICAVLLAQDQTPEVAHRCGNLWVYLEARTICFGLEVLESVGMLGGVESTLRACCGCAPLAQDADGGCVQGILGRHNGVGRWYAWCLHFLMNMGFAITGLAVLPPALMNGPPNCLDALSASSFTGTYTLGIFAWLYLILDLVLTGGIATWLVQSWQSSSSFATTAYAYA